MKKLENLEIKSIISKYFERTQQFLKFNSFKHLNNPQAVSFFNHFKINENFTKVKNFNVRKNLGNIESF